MIILLLYILLLAAMIFSHKHPIIIIHIIKPSNNGIFQIYNINKKKKNTPKQKKRGRRLTVGQRETLVAVL